MKNLKIKNLLKKNIKFVCDIEMESLKPGNVHKYSPGHDMSVEDFLKSSLIISKCLTNNNLYFGEKIFNCVKEIKLKIKQNTNLGIILLLSPLVEVILNHGIISKKELLKKTKKLIRKQNIKNSTPIFKAISLASPGGLGLSKKYDVNKLPKTNIFKAMKYSEKKDFISRQYSNGYKDIFNIGLPAYEKYLRKWKNINWALTGVYLTFLKSFNDTHIIRKKGIKIAQNVKKEAKKYYKYTNNVKNLDKIKKNLLIFDKKLKSNGINPGTSADLTVATLFFELVTKKQ